MAFLHCTDEKKKRPPIPGTQQRAETKQKARSLSSAA